MTHSTEIDANKLKLIGLVCLVLVIFLVWIEGGFVSKTPPGLQTESVTPSGSETFAVSRQSAEGTISWPARIEPLKTIQIAPKFSGRILEIPVIAGTRVARGQLLIRLENSEVNARLAQTRAQLAAAEAASSRANADAARVRNLFGKEAATRQSLDAAVAEERQSHARVQEAKAATLQMESQLTESTLTAPYEGIIERRLMEPGDMAMPGQPILTFLQLPTLRIEASLPSHCAQEIRVGDTITAKSPQMEREMSAIVEEKEPASDRETQTQRIKARLEARPESPSPIPGSFVWLQHSCGAESIMLIPSHAIKHIGQLESVSIMVDGRPRIRHIRTGRSFGDSVEVLSGLNEGDLLLLGVH